MARLARLTVPGFAHHVVQRGNNGQPIFLDASDFEAMLAFLHEYARKFEVSVHAYVLLGSQFHLLATPTTVEALPAMMQALGRRYVRYFNDRHQRTGTLWDGQYRCTVLESEPYLLPWMLCMDLLPVQTGLAAQAADYPWSSCAHCVGTRTDRLLTVHPLYWALGNTPFARQSAYAQLVQAGIAPAVEKDLMHAVRKGWALGGPVFMEQLQLKTNRRVRKGTPGRPPARNGSR